MKKALILAGGKGTRLLPLTFFTPKPLIEFFDKTLCERIVLQLKSAGFCDIIISTGYKKEKIKEIFGENYCGVKIGYIEEDSPLGTAGALFYLDKIWDFEKDESFAVISGDCLFDFDITDAIKTHKTTRADVTVVSSKAKEPTEYGIINSDTSGKIVGFNEKPSWSQVTGCNVNTGIYFMKSDVTKLIPEKSFDFSNDLFPYMLGKNMHIQEHKAQGFWSDIGTPESYFWAISDTLNKKLKSAPQTSAEKLKELSQKGVKITQPVFISDSAEIGRGCVIGPYCTISRGSKIKSDTHISHTVIHKDCKIGKSAKINGAILLKNANVGDFCLVNESSIIKEGYTLFEHGVFSNNKEIYNKKENDIKKTFYFEQKKPLFSDDAVLISKIGEKAEPVRVCEKICRAIVAASSKNAKLGIMSETSHNCAQYAQYFVFSLENLGVKVYDFSEGFEKLSGFITASFRFDCFIYIFEKENSIYCKFFNKNSLPPSRDFERKFEFFYYNPKETENEKYVKSEKIDNSEVFYKNEIQDCLLSYCREDAISGLSVSFINQNPKGREFSILRQTFSELGGKTTPLLDAYKKNDLIVKYSPENGIVFEMDNICVNRYTLISGVLRQEKAKGATEFLLPLGYPKHYDGLFDVKDKIYSYPIHSAKKFNIPHQLVRSYHWLMDDILLAAKALSLIAEKGSLFEIIKDEEEFFYCENTIVLPEGFSKAHVMEKLYSDETNNKSDCFEGSFIEYPEGKVTVVPQNNSSIKIYTETKNENFAKKLFEKTENLLLS